MHKEALVFKLLWTGIWLIFFITPLVEYVTALGFLISLISFIVILCKKERHIFFTHMPLSYEIPLSIFLLFGFISAFFAADKSVAFGAAAGLTGGVILFYIVALYLGSMPEKIKKLFIPLLVPVCIIVLIGLYQLIFKKYTVHSLASEDNVIYAARLTSIFFFPNTFAGFLILSLPLCFGIILTNNMNKLYKGFFVFLWLAGLFCLIYTWSRGAWISFSFSILVFLFLLLRKRLKSTTILISLIIIILFVSFLVFEIDGLRPYFFRPFSDQSRLIIWTKALLMIRDHPFTGIGSGNFHSLYPCYLNQNELALPVEGRPWHAHNLYLNLAVENGIIGALAFFYFLMQIFISLFLSLRKKNEYKFIIYGLISALSGFLVLGFFDFVLDNVKSALYFFILLAFSSGMVKLINNEKEKV